MLILFFWAIYFQTLVKSIFYKGEISWHANVRLQDLQLQRVQVLNRKIANLHQKRANLQNKRKTKKPALSQGRFFFCV